MIRGNGSEGSLTVDANLILAKSQRFDLGFKLALANSWLRETESSYPEKAYLGHIEAFNGFFEAEPRKTCEQDFLDSFELLVKDLGGGKPLRSEIPVGSNGQIVDGSHRLAVAALLGLSVPVSHSNEAPSYDYRFFLARGLKDELADYGAIQRAKFDPTVRIVVHSPVVTQEQSEIFNQELARYGGFVIYEKSLRLTFNGLVNLFRVLYPVEAGNEWIGNRDNGFEGARQRAKLAGSRGPVVVKLVGGASEEDLLLLKESFRSFVGNGNPACHTTDSKEETYSISRELFHPVVQEVLLGNTGSLNIDKKQIETIDSAASGRDWFVGGSSVLEVFGLRRARDIDVFFQLAPTSEPLAGFDYSVFERGPLGHSLADLIEDPKMSFTFLGVRFLSPKAVIALKRQRLEWPKDYIDLLLLGSLRAPSVVIRVFRLVLEGLTFNYPKAILALGKKLLDTVYVSRFGRFFRKW